MKKAFSLIEILFVLFSFGIFAFLAQSIFLKIIENYKFNTSSLLQTQNAQNALFQIKKLLENAYFDSISYDFMPLKNTPQSIKNHSLIFYKKPQSFALFTNYALPCLQEFFNIDSMKISTNLTLDFIPIKAQWNPNLNQKCKIYQNPPEFALIKTATFISPQDFYNNTYKGRILTLNAHSLSLETPPIFKNLAAAPQIAPKIYYLKSPKILEFSNEILLKDSTQKLLILDNFEDAFIWQDSLGIWLKICVKNPLNTQCFSSIVTNLES
ncbi:MAG: hypothetical protein SOW25_06985 [Helicobacter sp.]|nr:hypothetical protein [Helicobacteraceae bacterium]MDY3114053.1 hypothetical protein [Helicobacter sp.]